MRNAINLLPEYSRNIRSAMTLLLVVCLASSLPAQVGGIKIVIRAGDHAMNRIHELGGQDMAVEVQTAAGNQPIAGAAVRFDLPPKGPGGTFADGSKSLTVTTDARGMAIVRGFRANDVAGEFTIYIEAFFQGRSATASMTQTNVKKAGMGKKIAIILAAAGGAAGAGIALKGRKSNGGSTTPPVATTTITPGTIVIGPPR